MIFFEFLYWYYVQAPVALWRIWTNFFLFFFDFFGFRYHARTLFRPWHAMVLRYEGASGVQKFFFTLFSCIVGSTVGFFMRSVVMLLGLAFLLISLVLLPILEFAWLLLPAGVFFLFFRGMTMF